MPEPQPRWRAPPPCSHALPPTPAGAADPRSWHSRIRARATASGRRRVPPWSPPRLPRRIGRGACLGELHEVGLESCCVSHLSQYASAARRASSSFVRWPEFRRPSACPRPGPPNPSGSRQPSSPSRPAPGRCSRASCRQAVPPHRITVAQGFSFSATTSSVARFEPCSLIASRPALW
jgi:hypothetical protein